MTDAEEASPAVGLMVEPPTALSRSVVWRLQRRFFAARGAAAFDQDTVPHYVTSNPVIAEAYAQVLLGWLRDQVDAGAVDPTRPIYVLELGAGSGRFGYLLHRRLRRSLAATALRRLDVRYVLSDASPALVQSWRDHPYLQPSIAAGELDVLELDVEALPEHVSVAPGRPLGGEGGNPVAVVANYVFDAIPHDLFALREGRLEEALVALRAAHDEAFDLEDPDLLGRLQLEVTWAPAPARPYAEPDLAALLGQHQERLEETVFTFPCGALRLLERLRRLSAGRLLVLAADKGTVSEELLLGRGPPGIELQHGCLFPSVNFHALSGWARLHGGVPLSTRHAHGSLAVWGALFGAAREGRDEARLAYETAIERRGPDDFFVMKKWTEAHYEDMDLVQLLAHLRLAAWDPRILLGCLPALTRKAEQAGEGARHQLLLAVQEVWANDFPIGEELDLGFELGVLLSAIGYHAEAVELFERSLELRGPDPSTSFNIARSLYLLRRLEEALSAIDSALEQAPDLPQGRVLRLRIETALGARTDTPLRDPSRIDEEDACPGTIAAMSSPTTTPAPVERPRIG